MRRHLLAAHQPDLFPYSGFWAKMAMADVFDLAIHDQFQKQGYQRRVLMAGSWASIPVIKPELGARIKDVHLAENAPQHLLDTIRGRYRHLPLWKTRGELIESWFVGAPDGWLWEFNVHMIMQIRDLLGISTPLDMVDPPEGKRLDGIIDVCRQYGATEYLSGSGGQAYMGEEPGKVMKAAGVDLFWLKHTPRTGESVLTTILEVEDFHAEILTGEKAHA